jgi:ATPase subunit of ABC transporter with duplicated ATPase domains
MFDLELDSVTHMRNLQSAVGEPDSMEEARKYLGRFGLSGDLALRPIRTLSGGQKSRLAFAELAWRQPHILLLDEPTNHLDIETIEAMAMAINKFEGGVVLVSHDERLIQLCADELWHVERRQGDKPGSLTIFE